MKLNEDGVLFVQNLLSNYVKTKDASFVLIILLLLVTKPNFGRKKTDLFHGKYSSVLRRNFYLIVTSVDMNF